jgi:YHS domain-containing protein
MGLRRERIPKQTRHNPKETTMTSFVLKSALAGAMLLGLTGAAFAVTGEYDNMCTMGLALGKEVKTDCSVNATLEGKTYCFGNEEAKAMFMKNPKANLAKAEAFYEKKKQ